MKPPLPKFAHRFFRYFRTNKSSIRAFFDRWKCPRNGIIVSLSLGKTELSIPQTRQISFWEGHTACSIHYHTSMCVLHYRIFGRERNYEVLDVIPPIDLIYNIAA